VAAHRRTPHITDLTNASRTQLLDIHTGHWDDALLALFDIPRALLPQIVRSSGAVAETDATLFGAAWPIAGIAGDQQAALYGQGCSTPGLAKNTYGTGCFMLMHTGIRPSHRTTACSPPVPRRRRRASNTRSKAACS
jgi:glycerol kinase